MGCICSMPCSTCDFLSHLTHTHARTRTHTHTHTHTHTPCLLDFLKSCEEELRSLVSQVNEGVFVDPTSPPLQLLEQLKAIQEEVSIVRARLLGLSKWKEAITGKPYDLSAVTRYDRHLRASLRHAFYALPLTIIYLSPIISYKHTHTHNSACWTCSLYAKNYGSIAEHLTAMRESGQKLHSKRYIFYAMKRKS